MIKKHYLNEIADPTVILRKGSEGEYARKVQEWLVLNTYVLPGWNFRPAVDGDFGLQTDMTVREFQRYFQLTDDGLVGPLTWKCLVAPMVQAFDMDVIMSQMNDPTVREIITAVALQHLKGVPRELQHRNLGPWVRAYMDGLDGDPWHWCVGSAITILDQAMSAFDMDFRDHVANTYGCDVLGGHAKQNNRLIRNSDLRQMQIEELKKAVQPGDLFNLQKGPHHWYHTGLILEVHADYVVTWEGNTNDEGSWSGFEVCKRVRNFHKQKLDVIQLGV